MISKIFSSFYQTKGLLWRPEIEAILKNDFKPPIGAALDLTNKCNLNCYWCIAQSYRSKDTLSQDDIAEIIEICSKWGVKSICFGGGGEPTLSPHFSMALEYTVINGMEAAISTNGTTLTPEQIKVIGRLCKFCGFSVDAGTKETWSKVKKSPPELWDKIMKNIKALSKYRNKCEVTYKMLITPENQGEIYEGAKLAKKLGCNVFYCRFPAFEHVPNVDFIKGYDKNLILNQFRKVERLEDKNFMTHLNINRSVDIAHGFRKKVSFDKCRATPLLVVFCADGWAYPCIDIKGQKKWRMSKNLDIINYWNSKKHHKLLEKINKDNCPHCAFSIYNEIIQAYKNDYMFRNIP